MLPGENELDTYTAEEIEERKRSNLQWKVFLEERKRRLDETDYIVIMHTERGESVPEEWRTYRQKLRDLTIDANPNFDINDDNRLININWPEKP